MLFSHVTVELPAVRFTEVSDCSGPNVVVIYLDLALPSYGRDDWYANVSGSIPCVAVYDSASVLVLLR